MCRSSNTDTREFTPSLALRSCGGSLPAHVWHFDIACTMSYWGNNIWSRFIKWLRVWGCEWFEIKEFLGWTWLLPTLYQLGPLKASPPSVRLLFSRSFSSRLRVLTSASRFCVGMSVWNEQLCGCCFITLIIKQATELPNCQWAHSCVSIMNRTLGEPLTSWPIFQTAEDRRSWRVDVVCLNIASSLSRPPLFFYHTSCVQNKMFQYILLSQPHFSHISCSLFISFMSYKSSWIPLMGKTCRTQRETVSERGHLQLFTLINPRPVSSVLH